MTRTTSRVQPQEADRRERRRRRRRQCPHGLMQRAGQGRVQEGDAVWEGHHKASAHKCLHARFQN